MCVSEEHMGTIINGGVGRRGRDVKPVPGGLPHVVSVGGIIWLCVHATPSSRLIFPNVVRMVTQLFLVCFSNN